MRPNLLCQLSPNRRWPRSTMRCAAGSSRGISRFLGAFLCGIFAQLLEFLIPFPLSNAIGMRYGFYDLFLDLSGRISFGGLAAEDVAPDKNLRCAIYVARLRLSGKKQ